MKDPVEVQGWGDMASVALPSDFTHNSFAEATEIIPSHKSKDIYEADIKRDWCIGIVPHGGYLTSVVATATKYHFDTKHPELNQPDLITFHVEFLSRSAPGPAEIQIHELKLGRQFSTVRAQLHQYPGGDRSKKPRICMEAHITQGNLAQEARSGGVSLPTRRIQETYDVPSREGFEEREKDTLEERIRPAAFKIISTFPPGTDKFFAHPRLGPSVAEIWVHWTTASSPSRGFTPLSLPFLADDFRPLPEAYGLKDHWYPTLSYGLEIKKAPPTDEGWKWLFLRIEVHVVRDGRFDVSLLILDEGRELVALGNHVTLIVSSERNLKAIGAKI